MFKRYKDFIIQQCRWGCKLESIKVDEKSKTVSLERGEWKLVPSYAIVCTECGQQGPMRDNEQGAIKGWSEQNFRKKSL